MFVREGKALTVRSRRGDDSRGNADIVPMRRATGRKLEESILKFGFIRFEQERVLGGGKKMDIADISYSTRQKNTYTFQNSPPASLELKINNFSPHATLFQFLVHKSVKLRGSPVRTNNSVPGLISG